MLYNGKPAAICRPRRALLLPCHKRIAVGCQHAYVHTADTGGKRNDSPHVQSAGTAEHSCAATPSPSEVSSSSTIVKFLAIFAAAAGGFAAGGLVYLLIEEGCRAIASMLKSEPGTNDALNTSAPAAKKVCSPSGRDGRDPLEWLSNLEKLLVASGCDDGAIRLVCAVWQAGGRAAMRKLQKGTWGDLPLPEGHTTMPPLSDAAPRVLMVFEEPASQRRIVSEVQQGPLAAEFEQLRQDLGFVGPVQELDDASLQSLLCQALPRLFKTNLLAHIRMPSGRGKWTPELEAELFDAVGRVSPSLADAMRRGGCWWNCSDEQLGQALAHTITVKYKGSRRSELLRMVPPSQRTATSGMPSVVAAGPVPRTEPPPPQPQAGVEAGAVGSSDAAEPASRGGDGARAAGNMHAEASAEQAEERLPSTSLPASAGPAGSWRPAPGELLGKRTAPPGKALSQATACPQHMRSGAAAGTSDTQSASSFDAAAVSAGACSSECAAAPAFLAATAQREQAVKRHQDIVTQSTLTKLSQLVTQPQSWQGAAAGDIVPVLEEAMSARDWPLYPHQQGCSDDLLSQVPMGPGEQAELRQLASRGELGRLQPERAQAAVLQVLNHLNSQLTGAEKAGELGAAFRIIQDHIAPKLKTLYWRLLW